MEHLRLLIDGLDRSRFHPMIVVRPGDGEQTKNLAAKTGCESVELANDAGFRKVRRIVRQKHVRFVHVHTPVVGGVARTVLAGRLSGATSFVTYHQVQLVASSGRRRGMNRILQKTLVRKSLAVGRAVAESLERNAGLDSRRIAVVYNGVAPYRADASRVPLLARTQGEMWAGYFGRLAGEKGVGDLLDAVAAVRNRHPQFKLVIVGDGYERDRLMAQASCLGLKDHVTFAGFRGDARAIMREVDLAVHPPLFEGLPYALIEACEAGLPIVATSVAGGIAEIVRDGVNGVLVPPSDPGALAAAISMLIADASERIRLGANGRRLYEEHFTSDRMVGEIVRLYEHAL